ncbi:MAG: TonB-dependent receptor, partial [Chitinophagaceae bacterium]
RLASVFMQAEAILPKGWIVTAGMSLNTTAVTFNRLSVVPSFQYNTRFNNELAPRVSLLKKITGALSVYGLVSKGFSPPTVAELLPSTSVINTELQAEKGINYELGFRGGLFANRLSLDINAFDFRLQNAITQRRDISGADYFQNAGDTKQQGLEGAVSYQVIRNSDRLVNKLIAWFNYTYQDFHYKNFKQLNNDFSGKQIPSIAPHTVASGIDLDTKPGWYGSLTYYYSDPIALNDANSDFASSYNLLGFRTGIRKSFGNRLKADIFISGDNLLNEKYSLGNDINAAGSRFYNTAAGVNYQAGVSLQYVSK